MKQRFKSVNVKNPYVIAVFSKLTRPFYLTD